MSHHDSTTSTSAFREMCYHYSTYTRRHRILPVQLGTYGIFPPAILERWLRSFHRRLIVRLFESCAVTCHYSLQCVCRTSH